MSKEIKRSEKITYFIIRTLDKSFSFFRFGRKNDNIEDRRGGSLTDLINCSRISRILDLLATDFGFLLVITDGVVLLDGLRFRKGNLLDTR